MLPPTSAPQLGVVGGLGGGVGETGRPPPPPGRLAEGGNPTGQRGRGNFSPYTGFMRQSGVCGLCGENPPFWPWYLWMYAMAHGTRSAGNFPRGFGVGGTS